MTPASGTIGTLPQSPANGSPVYSPPLSLRGGIVPGKNSAYRDELSKGRADAMVVAFIGLKMKPHSMACESGDPMVVTISMGKFHDMRHARVDAETAALVAAHAQDPPARQPVRARHRDPRKKDRPVPYPDRRYAATDSRRRPDRSARSATRDEPATWARKDPASLMGLCNRISTSTIDSLVPKIVKAIETNGDSRKSVDTIMTCLARSDAYIGMYVTVLERARAVAGLELESAIAEYSRQFLDTAPFQMPPSPDPIEDYDGFCASVKEKRRLANSIEAIARLGFGAEIASRARDALDLVADPHTSAQKDLAIAFIGTAVRHGPRECAKEIPGVEIVQTIAADPLRHGLDSRTRFALVDLSETMVRASRAA